MAFNFVNAVQSLANIVKSTGPSVQNTGGSEGQSFASEVDGKWYQRAKAGQLFTASTGFALANTPIIPTITSASAKAPVIVNPTTSTSNLQIAEINVGLVSTATAVIGSLGLMYQNPLTTPTATAQLGTITSALVGSGVTDTTTVFYQRMTYVGTPTIFKTLGLSFGTTTANAGLWASASFEDGMVNMAPGSSLGIFSSVAQTAGFIVSITYAKVPT